MSIQYLASRDDVLKLKERTRLFDRPAAFRVCVTLASKLSVARQRVLERRLAFALSDCGCGLASLALVAAPLLLYAFSSYAFLSAWPAYVAIAVVAAVTGKLLGLFLSYRLAHRTLDELLSAWAAAAKI